MPKNLTTSVGRFVQGDCFEMQTTDQQGRPRVVLSGPNQGQPAPQLFVGVAFDKRDPAWFAYWSELVAEAAAGFPQLFPQGPQPAHGPESPTPGGCVLKTFAYKVVDGDGYDTSGKHNATKEGFAGHWVVRFTGGFAVKVWRWAGSGHVEITNPAEIKRGYFVRVAHSLKANGNATKPGLYLSPSLVELTAYGEEIVSGPSPSEAFGAPPPALPPGASTAPLAPAMAPPGAPAAAPPAGNYTPPGALGAAPMHMAAPPAAYAAPPAAAPAPAPQAAPPPYGGFVGAPPAAAPPAAPAAPPAAPVRQMTAQATTTYEAYIAGGWTDAQLVQHGLMLP